MYLYIAAVCKTVVVDAFLFTNTYCVVVIVVVARGCGHRLPNKISSYRYLRLCRHWYIV